ncbi:hypothetical protein [Bradyrhizobium sp. CB3481]|uniref:hypothetical protein n=1 Tax=Bradyrhizobium sp. CB3481 TaxID=3039158 RepID=UPI0024B05AF0|nr:hypothetical protein [Bradyrhizobium sp. CB3481]WFU15988.1 hypothetical protein QA643_34360 [Bradyrhizobium sp. CB3481]
MGGDFIGCWPAGSGRRTARQAKPGYSAKVLACGAWLLSCVIVAGMATQTALAETAAPAATRVTDSEREQGDPGVAPASRTRKPEGEPALRQNEAQKPAPEAAVQMPDARKSSHEAKDPAKDLTKDLPVPQLVLPGDLAKKIGQKIWLNETGGKIDAITSWNANEEFASLGIGHFIWFPVGKWLPFEESFPALLEFMRQKNVRLPAWLDQAQIPANPWTSRAEFRRNVNSPRMKELRQFMLDTVAEQTQFMVVRAQGAMEKILKTTPDGTERDHIVIQFTRVIRASEDFYPLIDYINFKGEGTNPNEAAMDRQTGRRQGWGLKQVLLRMNGVTGDPKAVRAEFADAAQFVLQQRVRNLPSNRVFEAGWLRRVATYRRPIADPESNPERALRKSLRVTAAQ